MPKSIKVPRSIINDFNLLQLADDTALLSEEKSCLYLQFKQCVQFSMNNYMFTNVDKTFFLHLSDKPNIDSIVFDGKTIINPAIDNEYMYLGLRYEVCYF